MAIHAGIPEKAVKASLTRLRERTDLADVSWDVAKSRPGRPIKVYFEAETMAEIQVVKRALEQDLNEHGFDLYP
nr:MULTISPECIES: hypothetical protein [Deinococcus]